MTPVTSSEPRRASWSSTVSAVSCSVAISEARSNCSVKPPRSPERADTAIVESTYGGAVRKSHCRRTPTSRRPSGAQPENQPVVVISYTLDRTQRVLYLLRRAQTKGLVPELTPHHAIALGSGAAEMTGCFRCLAPSISRPPSSASRASLVDPSIRRACSTKTLRARAACSSFLPVWSSPRPGNASYRGCCACLARMSFPWDTRILIQSRARFWRTRSLSSRECASH